MKNSTLVVERNVEALVSRQTQPQKIGQQKEERKPQTHAVEISERNNQKRKCKEERNKSPDVLLCREEISPHHIHSKKQNADRNNIPHTQAIDGVPPGDAEDYIHDNPAVREEVVRKTEGDLEIAVDSRHVLAARDGN